MKFRYGPKSKIGEMTIVLGSKAIQEKVSYSYAMAQVLHSSCLTPLLHVCCLALIVLETGSL